MKKKVLLFFFIWLVSSEILPARTSGFQMTHVGEWGSGSYQDIFVQGPYAYCAASYAGLDIVSIADPQNPSLVGNAPGNNYQNVFVEGAFAYVAQGNGLDVIDISNPAIPVAVASLAVTGFSQGMVADGPILYMARSGPGVAVIDISTPSQPQLLTLYDTPGFARDIWIDGSLAYVADDSAGLTILDVSNPSSPQFVTGIDPGDGRGVAVKTEGNLAYLAADQGGLYIFDVSNPAKPSLLGSWDSFPRIFTDIVVRNGLAYITEGLHFDGINRLVVMDVNDPANPTPMGQWWWSGNPNGLQIQGDYAHIAFGSAGLRIVDVANPAVPTRAGSWDYSGWGTQVKVRDGHAFFANGNLQFLDISDPGNPVRLSQRNDVNSTQDVVLKDSYALVADFRQGLVVYDITDLQQTSLEGAYFIDGLEALAMKDDLLYTAGFLHPGGLRILDVADPTKPTLKSFLPISTAYDIFLGDGVALMTANQTEFHVVDITDPNQPLPRAILNLDHARKLTANETHAFVAAWTDGVLAIDITDLDAPTVVGQYPNANAAYEVTLHHNLLYVAAETNNFVHVLDVRDPTQPCLIGLIQTIGRPQGMTIDSGYLHVAASNSGKLHLIEIPAYAFPDGYQLWRSDGRRTFCATPSPSVRDFVDYINNGNLCDFLPCN